MNELIQSRPAQVRLSCNLVLWADRGILWLAQHRLAVFNGFLALYVGLAFLAPVLLASGYVNIAQVIYAVYRLDCHQLPSRSYFITGEQVAFCHRHVSMYGALLGGGLLFNLVRHRLKPPTLRWYVFFLVPEESEPLAGLRLDRWARWPLRCRPPHLQSPVHTSVMAAAAALK